MLGSFPKIHPGRERRWRAVHARGDLGGDGVRGLILEQNDKTIPLADDLHEHSVEVRIATIA